MIIGHHDDVNLAFLGGSSHAERCRALLTQSYIQVTDDMFQLALFQVHYPKKFVTLTHRDVLGALMNIGVKREKFGDIFIRDETIQFVAASEIADFIQWNVEKIGRATVQIERIPLTDHIIPKKNWEEKLDTVSSMRLDAVIAQLYHFSRNKVCSHIEKGQVTVNWKTVDHPSFLVAEGDYITVRGFGRTKIKKIKGKTRKNNIRLQYKRLK